MNWVIKVHHDERYADSVGQYQNRAFAIAEAKVLRWFTGCAHLVVAESEYEKMCQTAIRGGASIYEQLYPNCNENQKTTFG